MTVPCGSDGLSLSGKHRQSLFAALSKSLSYVYDCKE